MSDGDIVNPAPKTEHHAAKRARLASEYQEALDAAGVETLDELLAKLKESPVHRPDEEVYQAPSDAVDPLAAITPETDVVYLCSERSSFVLIGEQKGWVPPVRQVSLQAATRRAWASCPFESNTGDPIFDTQNNVMYGTWNHFVVSRNLCESLHQDQRFPLPETAVIASGDFKGWSSHANRALGVQTSIDKPDALRETIRNLLQRGGASTYMCADYPGMAWCFSDPNPYSADPPGGLTVIPFDALKVAAMMGTSVA